MDTAITTYWVLIGILLFAPSLRTQDLENVATNEFQENNVGALEQALDEITKEELITPEPSKANDDSITNYSNTVIELQHGEHVNEENNENQEVVTEFTKTIEESQSTDININPNQIAEIDAQQNENANEVNNKGIQPPTETIFFATPITEKHLDVEVKALTNDEIPNEPVDTDNAENNINVETVDVLDENTATPNVANNEEPVKEEATEDNLVEGSGGNITGEGEITESTLEEAANNADETTIDAEVSNTEAPASESSAPPETAPENSAPAETVPQNSLPVETAPENSAPAETAPENAAPAETAPENSAPVETTPENSAPVETAPENSAPAETAPENSAPAETAPENSAPAETAPENSAPAEVPAENSKPLTACTTVGNFPHENDCHFYYTCATTLNGIERVDHACPIKTAFNIEYGRCTRDISACTDDNAECLTAGSYVDPLDNNSYYRCVPKLSGGFRKYHITCNAGDVFIPELGKCFIDINNLENLPLGYGQNNGQLDDEQLMKMELKEFQKAEKAKLKAQKLKSKLEKKLQDELAKKAAKEAKEQAKAEAENFICTEEGNFASAQSQNRFFSCISKKGKLKALSMMCPIGHGFNQESGACIAQVNTLNDESAVDESLE